MHLIVYHSKSMIAPEAFDDELQKIYASCTRNNVSNEVTGVLLHEGGYFVQLLEGEKASLEDVMARVTQDARHADIVVVVDEPIEQRQFPDWAMETFYLSNPEILQASTLENLRDIYLNSNKMESSKFVLFLKEMLDQIDVFNIRNP